MVVMLHGMVVMWKYMQHCGQSVASHAVTTFILDNVKLKSIKSLASQLALYYTYMYVTSSNPASNFSLIPHSSPLYGVYICTHAYPNYGLGHIGSRE